MGWDREEELKGLRRDRRGGRGVGISPSACILWLLIRTFPQGYLPCPTCLDLTGKKDQCWQSGFESLLLPQVGKIRINSGAAGRGNALAQQAKNEKTLPHLVLLTNPSCKAGCMCVCELLIQTNVKFAHCFQSFITIYSPQCPSLSPTGIKILQGYC